VARAGDITGAYSALFEKKKGKTPLRKPRRRRKDSITEIKWNGVDWTNHSQNTSVVLPVKVDGNNTFFIEP
jgi:hypothetical protein